MSYITYKESRVASIPASPLLRVMKKIVCNSICGTVISLLLIACPVLYFTVGPALSGLQIETLRILLIVAGCSALWCFLVGEISGNNSQMDKLWSILPPVYMWIIACKSGWNMRLVIMAGIITAWGMRLTFNFSRRGAYRLKFWEGSEDYRWSFLRRQEVFKPRWKWVVFDLGFISLYQNLLVLALSLPALMCQNSTAPFSLADGVATALMAGFIIFEAVADEQQWAFQSIKHTMLAQGVKTEDLPAPFCLGFNTVGLWNHSRHPNYLGELGV